MSALFPDDGGDASRVKEYQTSLTYELVECCSCEYIDLRPAHELSGAPGFAVRFHPQRSARSIPSWRRELPSLFTPLVDELYTALNTECRVLAIAGARLVVDIVLRQKAPDVVSFRGGLQSLEESGFVRHGAGEFLWRALVTDGAIPHAPTLETLNHVMDVVEELLHAVYVARREPLRQGSHADAPRAIRGVSEA